MGFLPSLCNQAFRKPGDVTVSHSSHQLIYCSFCSLMMLSSTIFQYPSNLGRLKDEPLSHSLHQSQILRSAHQATIHKVQLLCLIPALFPTLSQFFLLPVLKLCFPFSRFFFLNKNFIARIYIPSHSPI